LALLDGSLLLDHATGRDHHRKAGHTESVLNSANVPDEGRHVLFVFQIQPAVLVVPSLVVAETCDLEALTLVIGEVLLGVFSHLSDKLKNPVIEIAWVIGQDR
jgi:hypothetical protein